MNDDDIKGMISILFIAIFLSLSIGGLVAYDWGMDKGIERMQKEAIAHKFAGYNRDTGKFEWNHIKETN